MSSPYFKDSWVEFLVFNFSFGDDPASIGDTTRKEKDFKVGDPVITFTDESNVIVLFLAEWF